MGDDGEGDARAREDTDDGSLRVKVWEDGESISVFLLSRLWASTSTRGGAQSAKEKTLHRSARTHTLTLKEVRSRLMIAGSSWSRRVFSSSEAAMV